MPRTEKIVEMARRVISDPIFGYVYFMQKLVGARLERDEIIVLMKEHTVLTEELYKRRAQTVVSWTDWINDNFTDFQPE